MGSGAVNVVKPLVSYRPCKLRHVAAHNINMPNIRHTAIPAMIFDGKLLLSFMMHRLFKFIAFESRGKHFIHNCKLLVCNGNCFADDILGRVGEGHHQ